MNSGPAQIRLRKEEDFNEFRPRFKDRETVRTFPFYSITPLFLSFKKLLLCKIKHLFVIPPTIGDL